MASVNKRRALTEAYTKAAAGAAKKPLLGMS
jgi:hypothetical protein